MSTLSAPLRSLNFSTDSVAIRVSPFRWTARIPSVSLAPDQPRCRSCAGFAHPTTHYGINLRPAAEFPWGPSCPNFRELRGGEVRSTGTPRSSLHSMVGCGHVPLRLSAMVPGATGAGQGRDRPVPQLWVAARGRPRVRVQLDVRRPVSGRFGVPRLRGRCRRLSHLHRGSAELRPRPGREPAPHPRDRHLVSKRTSENSPSETVWKFGIDPESGLRSGQEGSKKSRSAASWRQRRVLETPSAIFQTVSPRRWMNKARLRSYRARTAER